MVVEVSDVLRAWLAAATPHEIASLADTWGPTARAHPGTAVDILASLAELAPTRPGHGDLLGGLTRSGCRSGGSTRSEPDGHTDRQPESVTGRREPTAGRKLPVKAQAIT
jgi:hypothetical protein